MIKVWYGGHTTLQETLDSMVGRPVKVDTDMRLHKDAESDINAILRRHGMRVARDEDGLRPFLGTNTDLAIEPIDPSQIHVPVEHFCAVGDADPPTIVAGRIVWPDGNTSTISAQVPIPDGFRVLRVVAKTQNVGMSVYHDERFLVVSMTPTGAPASFGQCAVEGKAE